MKEELLLALSQPAIVHSQQEKHWNKVWNMFKDDFDF